MEDGLGLSRPLRTLRRESGEELEGLQTSVEVTEAGVAGENEHEGQQRQPGPN